MKDENQYKEDKIILKNNRNLKSVKSNTSKSDVIFSGLPRTLSEEDLNDKGVQKLIINQLDNYNLCREQLEEYVNKFHEADKKIAVLESKLNSSISTSLLMTIGSILIGLTPSIIIYDKSYITWIILSLGIISLFGSIIIKYKNDEFRNTSN